MRVGNLKTAALPAAILAGRAAQTWTYKGCYFDNPGNRTLTQRSTTNNDSKQTVELCTSYCQTNGFGWAGVEYGGECYCDTKLPSWAVLEPDTDCSMACNGDASEKCGNGNRLSVYSNGYTGPFTNPGPAGWQSLACYTDNGPRTLQNQVGASDNMTVATCTSACKAAGYSYAGVEYARECWCDNSIHSPGSSTSDGCTMLCSGNSTEYCGGSNRLNLYQATASTTLPTTGPGKLPAGWTAIGCYTDNTSNRTLDSSQAVPGGYTNMTVEGCLNVCSSQGFTYGGVEYSQECFCGNSIKNGGACATDQTTCSMTCRGNTAETCGGSNRLNVYYSGSSTSVSACGAAGSTSSSSSSSSTSTPTSSPSPTSTSTSTVASTSSTTSSTTTTTSPVSTVCPSFWTNVVNDLAPSMRSNGLCTNFSRAAIRYAFHDAATFSTKTTFYPPAAGGADGSLLLSSTEINRTDNDGLHDFHAQLNQKFSQYKSAGYPLSAADLIQVAGALGVLSCPGGRIGRIYVGRTDTAQAAPDGLLPQAFGTGSDHDTIYQLFLDKGFTARDLAALIGAHTSSFANFQTAHGIPAGTPQDDTPGTWDVAYYNETYFPPAGIGRFDSDVNLSKNKTSAVGKQFASFVGATGAWAVSFQSAFQTLSLLGVNSTVQKTMQDCTVVVSNAAFGS